MQVKTLFPIARFDEESSRRIRFLTDLEEAEEFVFHYDWKQKVDALCDAVHSKTPCKYCKQNVARRTRWGFYILDLVNYTVEIIISIASKFSMLEPIIEASEANGGLKDKDFRIDRDGYAKDTKFVLTPVGHQLLPKKCPEDLDKFSRCGNRDNMEYSVRNFFEAPKAKV